ncbi:MAG TPA: PAS domain S-box protein, partial [Coleofasciculaceae cyanobacterium]
RLLAYGVALLSVAFALGLALLLGVWIRPTPAALFFVAVMVSAWYGGLGAGLVTTVLSTLAINYYFVPPYYSWKITEPGSVIPLGVFVMAALLISGLNESRRLALRQEQRLRTASEAAQREEQAAKERLETVLSSIKDGFYVLDCNWRYTYVNDRYCQIAGMQREEILGQNIWELFPDDVDTDFYVQFQRALSEQKPVQFEYLYTTWNRWFEYRVYPTPNGLTVFIAEMTEHRQAELEIRKFVSLADNSTEFIGMCDMNFVPFYVNEGGRQLVGLDDARQYSETPVQEFFFPDDQDFIVNEFFPQVLREGRAEVEIRFRHFKTGEALWMIYNVFYIRGENDQPIGLATVSRNISDRKRAEKGLQESEERFRLVTHAVNGLVFDWNLQTNETYRSEKLYELVGVYPEEAPPSATWWHERIHPDDLARLQPQVAELFASSGDRYEREYRVRHENGRWVDVWERGCLIRDDQGQVIRVVGSTVDISERQAALRERKQAEAALRQSEERFRVSQELSLDAFTILNTVRDETGVILDFEWTYVNPKAAEILQHSADELVGQRLLAVLPGNQTNTELFERYVQVVETGEPHDIELSYNADGITGWFRNMAVKLDNGVAIFFSDITERKRAEAALRESERRFRRLVESNMFGVVFGDFTGSIHYANDYWLKMVGYTREEIEAGQVRWTDITPPEFLPLDEQAVAELGHSGVATPFEKEYIRKDGTRVPILIGSALLQEPYNQQQEIISFFLDLTERKQAEVAWRDGKQTLDAIMDYIPEGITIADAPEVTIRQVSRHGQQLTGRPKDVIVGIPATEHVAKWGLRRPDGSQPSPEELPLSRAVLQGEVVTDEEWVLQRPDGSQLNILCNAGPIQNQDGNPMGGIIAWRDITERKQSEEALRQALQKLNFHVENTPMAVIEWDREFQVTRWGGAAEEIFGWQAEEVIGKPLADLRMVVEEDIEKVTQVSRRLMSGEEPYVFSSNCNYTKHGDIVHCEWYNSSLRDQSSRMVSVLSLVLDVTDKKQAEVERNQLLLQEQAAREAAESANRIKDEFLAVLSHELRSPLNPILGWSKLLRSRQLDEHRAEHALETIERNAQMQAQLINDLLDVSRILRGKLSLNANSVDLVSTIQAAMETVRLAADAKSIQIHTRFEPEVGRVWGDSGRLQQVIWNLLSNAVKFTPQGGRVDIQLTRLDAHARITISDTGKGIHPDFLPYVFDHFRQEDAATTRRFGGLGLGLAIVRHLVELHGGTVQVNSLGEGHGATFTVELPLMPHQSTTKPETKPSRQSLDLKGIQILVVDDDDSTREFLTFLLELHGAKVLAMASADKAMTTLAQFKPDVLLSDIGMPDVDGYTLMRQVRALPPEQGGEIRAIALTAYAGEIDYQQAMAAGFQKHIPKPVEPDKLVEAIASLFGNRT